MKSLIKTLTFFLLFSSCDKLFNDDELNLPLTPYTGDELRIDGYYYALGYEGQFSGAYFFYNNGCFLNASGVEKSLEDMDKYIRRYFINNSSYKRTRIGWGAFLLENDSIIFESWQPSERPHRTYIRAGTIINDTTFHITEGYRLWNGEKVDIREVDWTFYFRQFSPKPDSANRFVH